MVLVLAQKDKAYYKRFQVKYKRRRNGKTDYRRRTNLIRQDKNKYASPKYRFIVRFTNKKVICQIAYATVEGDVIMASATSAELPRYGLKVGLTNYAATYCTGLLVARRLLQELKMDTIYEGNTEIDGQDYYVGEEEGRRPFYCLLDVGLKRTTTGSRVFAAMKGGADGGLEIPHGESRYVGYDNEEGVLNAEKFKEHLLGGHVATYMANLQDDEEKYKKQFSQYIKNGVNGGDLEALYLSVHKAIRADPAASPAKEKKEYNKDYRHPAKTSYTQRKNRIKLIKESHARRQAAAEE